MWLHRSDVGLFVAVDGDSVVGVAGVSWTPMFFGRATRYANELFWYVKPDQRRKGTGVLLRESIEGWAALQGCAFIYLTTFDDVPPDGYERQQTLFVRRLG